jgi:NIPSNAP protein
VPICNAAFKPQNSQTTYRVAAMIIMCIRYTIDRHKLDEFEQYARRWPEPIKRCGGELLGYFLPTKLAGPTNIALALINFRDLAAYGRYREALMKDSDAIANVSAADQTQCILIEDRSFLRRVPE